MTWELNVKPDNQAALRLHGTLCGVHCNIAPRHSLCGGKWRRRCRVQSLVAARKVPEDDSRFEAHWGSPQLRRTTLPGRMIVGPVQVAG